MRRFVHSGVTVGIVLLLAFSIGVLYYQETLAGQAWNPRYSQQAKCPVGKYSGDCAIPTPKATQTTGTTGTSQTYEQPQASQVIATPPPPETLTITQNTATSYLYAGKKLAKISNNQIEFFHDDHLGTAAARTNSAGAILETSRQLPFGQQIGSTSKETDFTGKKMDGGTGLDYFNARYYLPAIGRFVESDPILDAAQSNYAYGNNNPVLHVDPDGKNPLVVLYNAAASYAPQVTAYVNSLLTDPGNAEDFMDLGNSINGLSGTDYLTVGFAVAGLASAGGSGRGMREAFAEGVDSISKAVKRHTPQGKAAVRRINEIEEKIMVAGERAREKVRAAMGVKPSELPPVQRPRSTYGPWSGHSRSLDADPTAKKNFETLYSSFMDAPPPDAPPSNQFLAAWNKVVRQNDIDEQGKFGIRGITHFGAHVTSGGWHYPSQEDVPGLLSDWRELTGLSQQYYSREASARMIQGSFIGIHPFVNGNGRTGALLYAMYR